MMRALVLGWFWRVCSAGAAGTSGKEVVVGRPVTTVSFRFNRTRTANDNLVVRSCLLPSLLSLLVTKYSAYSWRWKGQGSTHKCDQLVYLRR